MTQPIGLVLPDLFQDRLAKLAEGAVHVRLLRFKWSELAPDFGFGLFMFLVLYATSLFLLAVILVPPRLSVVVDSWEYFLAIRYWFYGGLLVVNGIDVVDTFMKGTEWGFRTNYVVYWAALAAVGIVGLNTTRRRVHTSLGIAMLLWTNALSVFETDILGGW